MKVGIYDPYIDVLGGGERYVATIAELLSKVAPVDLFVPQIQVKQKLLYQFNLNLNQVTFLSNEIFKKKGILDKLHTLKKYDIFFYVTDGSLFFSSARNNFLIIQSPAHFPQNYLLNKFKLSNWKIICYSDFIAQIIRERIGLKSTILSPAIEENSDSSRKKENIILSVGRFFKYPHNKKQDILIEVFKANYKNKFKNYSLILAGGLTEESGKVFLTSLRKKATGFPIYFSINLSFNELNTLYARAKIYWHAAGYGEDLDAYPERAEHFGITTLEAMRSGCAPLVFAGGGQIEIIKDGENGYLWKNKEDLVNKTSQIIIDEKLRNSISANAKRSSSSYSKEKFYARLKKILSL